MATFNIRRYLGLDGSPGVIKHDNTKNPIPEELLDRLDKDLTELIARVVGAKNQPTSGSIDAPRTAAEFTKCIDIFIGESGLASSYPPGDPTIAALAQKAEELVNSPDALLNSPEQVKERVKLALYRVVIYCDDSYSMVMAGDRVQAQADFCSLVADYILPLNVQGGLSLRWINNSTAHDGLTSSSQLVNIIKGANYFYYTPIGTGLKNHVLTPYWTNYCNDQTSNGGRIRPLLVIVITDGWPYQEPESYFQQVITENMDELKKAGFNPHRTIRYELNQIGDEARAEAFIRGLLEAPALKKNMHCTSSRLENKLAELRDNKLGLQTWFHALLTTGKAP